MRIRAALLAGHANIAFLRFLPRIIATHPANSVSADPAAPGSISGAAVLATVQVPGDEFVAVSEQTGTPGPLYTSAFSV
jgi:hypothetical protein